MVINQPGGGEWPSTRWQLSAPESYVLLNGAAASGREAFKLALVELVTRGTLVLRQIEGSKPLMGKAKKVSVLTEGGKPAPADRPLRALMETFQSLPAESFSDGTRGVRVEKLAEAARKRYKAIGRYVPVDVLPSLLDGGFFRTEQHKVMFVISRERQVLTEKGEQAKMELQQLMGIGRSRLREMVDREPAQALAYLGLAGAGVLLMSDIFPDLQRLFGLGHMAEGAEAGWIATSALGDSDQRELSFEGLDFDFSAFDSLGDAFDSIDSSVDAGGGSDSGSDSSDSGGGGGD